MNKHIQILAMLPALVLLLSGCFSSREITVDPATPAQQSEYYGISGTTANGLEFDSLNYLQSSLYMDLYDDLSDELLRKLDSDFQKTKNANVLSVKADVCYNYALNSDDPDMANRYFLSAAATYFRILFESESAVQYSNRFDPRILRSTIRYNSCTGHIFTYMKKHDLLLKKGFHLPGANQESFYFSEFPLFDLPKVKAGYADMLLCSDYKPEKLLHFSYHFGLGAPIIAQTQNAAEEDTVLKLAKDLALPATCLLTFRIENGQFNARIEFHNSVQNDWIQIKNEKVPLTSDYSTPFAYFVDRRTSINLLRYMLMPIEDTHSGLYAMMPYDPQKIPVVFVHGLMSSPQTWIQLINTLYSDPVIRKNYQFWFYTYSSGNPVPLSAMKMREAVDKVQKVYGKNPKFNQMVIVGHSMGGLLAKTFVMNSGDSIIDEFLKRPWKEAKLKLQPQDVLKMEDLAVLKPRDYVSRIVFMAVPHKGSSVADGGIARLGARLIRLPVSMVTELTKVAIVLIPGATEKDPNEKYIKTGIDNLSPTNPLIQILYKQKLAENVKYNSIIGNNEKEGVPGGTDGIVPYDSSHLDFVESELVVKSGHSVQTAPETIRELGRILNLHLESLETRPVVKQ